MNKKNCLSIIAIFLGQSLFFPGFAFSDEQQLNQTEVLIQKFERIYKQTAPADESKVAITLRLADLWAEKGRILINQDMAQSCVQCTSGKNERNMALNYYAEVVNQLKDERKSRVKLQMGHLYEMNGHNEKAIEFYKEIISQEKSTSLSAEAEVSLGELFFRNKNFHQAQIHYQNALENRNLKRRGYTLYRLAWSQFTLGEIDKAVVSIKQILNSPQLLSHVATEDLSSPSIDEQFKEEVSRDLVTFIARQQVKIKDIEEIFSLSPEKTRFDHLTYLARELESQGQWESARYAWSFIYNRQQDALKRLEAQIHLTQLDYSQGLKSQAIKSFQQSLFMWKQLGSCPGELCSEVRARLRNFVIAWHQEEKIRPSEDVLNLYENFLSVFHEDSEMTIWAATVAGQLKKWSLAYQWYNKAIELSSQGNSSLESLLIGQIEAAEKLEQNDKLQIALEQYLKKSTEKTKWVEVRYQQALNLYREGHYEQSLPLLKEVAFQPEQSKPNPKVKVQAADLALDVLALQKRDQEMEILANQLAQTYSNSDPVKAHEYEDFSRRSVLNQAIKEAADFQEPQRLKKTLDILSRMKIAEAKDSELINYYKIKIKIEEKLQDISSMNDSLDQLLAIRTLSKADETLAWEQKLWIAELRLDFKTAYLLAEKLKSLDSISEKRFERMATFAELAGLRADPYYFDLIKTTQNKEKRLAAVLRLIQISSDPQKVLDELDHQFKFDTVLYSQLQYEVYLRNKNLKVAFERISHRTGIDSEPALNIWRDHIIVQIVDLKKKYEKQKINYRNELSLKKSMKQEWNLLMQGEKLLQESSLHEDGIAQMLSVWLLGKEHEKFYQEIISLPLPQNLSIQEQIDYKQALAKEAAPHQVRAAELKQKWTDFWSQSKIGENLLNQFTHSYREGYAKERLIREMGLVAEAAPLDEKNKIEDVLKKTRDGLNNSSAPTIVDLELARNQVKSHPFDQEPLKNLITIEKRNQQGIMVPYLEKRLAQLIPSSPINTLKKDEKK